ncbi:MAG: hypothetical protein HY907_17620 [Deltaproteobacteria bacterium]|nr:hypothetical protein [Deltaproteobacteria bacterium]
MHALLATSLLFTNAGEAQWEAFAEAMGEAMANFDLDFRAQGQLTATADLADGDAFETAELELNASIWGCGGAVAFGYDRLQPDGRGTLHGGHLRLAWQVRPFAWFDSRPHPFRWIDPSLEFGGALGGFDDENGASTFAGWGYLGAGLDLSPFPDDIPVVLTVRYRWTPDAMRSPDGLPQHHLVLGLGFRAAE